MEQVPAMEQQSVLTQRLRQEILLARERVHRFGRPTPLERLTLPGPGSEIWVKREDISPIKAYKWRGAANRMAVLSDAERAQGVVTASAGNHGQGVALAARQLGVKARIYMPRSSPGVKQQAVRQHGAGWVEIVLAGDSYDEAVIAARADQEATGAVYIHAYDDLLVMAGQGTLADEVVLSGEGPFDAAFLQIGGGGIAAGVSCWLRTYWPGIALIGVEGEGQASMTAAFAAGKPVALEAVDLFCDGTAVRQAGQLPFEVCQETLDKIITVSNAEVSQAMRVLWEGLRAVSEPSGAMGLAAALQEREKWTGKRILVVLCGANIDFQQLGVIASSTGAEAASAHTVRVRIPERQGAMLALLDGCFAGLNIADFQYGKNDQNEAWPVFTVTGGAMEDLSAKLNAAGVPWQELNSAVDVQFRAIPLRGDLLSFPLFLRLDFYERPGALHDFLDTVIRGSASFCYFNYRQSGERIGRALIGLDFESAAAMESFRATLPARGPGYRQCQPVDADVTRRLLGR
jgi:threonine dehydratase